MPIPCLDFFIHSLLLCLYFFNEIFSYKAYFFLALNSVQCKFWRARLNERKTAIIRNIFIKREIFGINMGLSWLQFSGFLENVYSRLTRKREVKKHEKIGKIKNNFWANYKLSNSMKRLCIWRLESFRLPHELFPAVWNDKFTHQTYSSGDSSSSLSLTSQELLIFFYVIFFGYRRIFWGWEAKTF